MRAKANVKEDRLMKRFALLAAFICCFVAALFTTTVSAAPPGQTADTDNAKAAPTVPIVAANTGGTSGLIANTDAILIADKQPPVAVAKTPGLKSATYILPIANTESSSVVALRIKPLGCDLIVMKLNAEPKTAVTGTSEVNRFGSTPSFVAVISSESKGTGT